MKHGIDGNPDYGEVTIALDPGEEILVESGAMSRMSKSLDMRGKLLGGFFKSIVRKLFAGESLFLGRYSGERGGWLCVSPRFPGTVGHRELSGDSFHLTATSFLACTPGVTLRTRFGGLRALFSREGAFFIECSGKGDLFYSAFGGVIEKEVDGSFVVDTGHLVAWEPSLTYRIGGMGGIKQTLFSGEGLVMRFEGRGKVWVQTRTLQELAGWLSPFCIGRG